MNSQYDFFAYITTAFLILRNYNIFSDIIQVVRIKTHNLLKSRNVITKNKKFSGKGLTKGKKCSIMSKRSKRPN
jgi:hypothetical protein